MTNYTTIVLGSSSHDNLLKQIEVVPINDESVTIIVITDKGHVQHKTITLKDVSHDEIKKTVGLINNLIVGTPIDEVSQKLEFEVKPIIGQYVEQHEQIYNAFYNVFTDFTNVKGDVNFVGKNKILDQPEFTNGSKMKELYSKLENKDIIDNIRSVHKDDSNNIEIYIGEENNIDGDVTVIKTNYKTNNDNGTIAIIGPKRMDYERVVGILEYIKENIER
jgi:heat-inducible transcriptional repressor